MSGESKPKKEYELIIAEKPQSAAKIAQALADKTSKKHLNKKVPYYELKHKGKDILIGCAVGHLYNLKEKDGKGWKYPTFSYEWQPSYIVDKSAKYTKGYIDTLKMLSKSASSFTVSTDYDEEGSLLGEKIIEFICKQKDAKRMKFSSLTKQELVYSYENAMPHLDWPQINAGETRHGLDWLNGINVSRALTITVRNAGAFKILSSGRVQGPALRILSDKEKKIESFKSEPLWIIQLIGDIKDKQIEAWHKKDKFWKKQEADAVLENTKGKKAIISKITKKEIKQRPPFPFDLTTLQIEAYRTLRISPKQTLALTQNLYIAGVITYPRTSSQQIPKTINCKKIVQDLSKQTKYKKLCNNLLKKSKLTPTNGPKKDPAHPPCLPTGEIPKKLTEQESKLYDLIVKRTLSTFSESAIRETNEIEINCNKELFIAKSIRTIKEGWYKFYKPYLKLEETELPKVKKDQEIKNPKFNLIEKETQPPKRYTPASIIKELEKKNLGTKCLTENTRIKIITNSPVKNFKISELFNTCKKVDSLEKGTSFAINNNRYRCFSIYNNSKITPEFLLVTKRKLNKKEKIYRLTFRDGTHIDLTGEHPILMYDKKLIYKKVKDVQQGDKTVSAFNYKKKIGNILFTWENFVKLCNQKTCLYGLSKELKDYREKTNLTQYDLAEKVGVKQSNISRYEKKNIIPFWIWEKINLKKPEHIMSCKQDISIKNPFPLKMSSSLARILGCLVGDGSIDKEKIKRENCYDFRYHNTNLILLNKFREDVNSIFKQDLNLKIKKAKHDDNNSTRYLINLPAILGRVFYMVSNELIEKNVSEILPEEFYSDFIAGLFDDEGHVYKNEPKLFISNTHPKLLEDVGIMLKKLDIKTILHKESTKKRKKQWALSYKLYIRGRYNIQAFLEKIPFIHLKKKQRLINHLSNFYKFGRKYSSTIYEKSILKHLSLSKDRELTSTKLAKKMNNRQVNIRNYLKHLRRNGYIKKRIVGINNHPRKKIWYQLIKPVENTFYPYLEEKIINQDFITKEVDSLKQIPYTGDVYDITNTENIPNFILSNNVVVHNSTRALIIDTLYDRHYIEDKSIKVTPLGKVVASVLEKYVPDLVSEKLTRHFEKEMEQIQQGKKKKSEVLEEAKKTLKKVLKEFKEKESEIGKELLIAIRETQKKASIVGKCQECDGNLRILYSKKTKKQFLACDRYPKCKTTFSLPRGKTLPTGKICKFCNKPIIKVVRAGKRPFEMCLTYDCKSKKKWKTNYNSN